MNKKNTIFGQILQLISRYEFQKAVKMQNGDKYNKGYTTWNHFVALLYAQLAGLDAIRAIVSGIAIYVKKLYHLGIKKIKRSTFSYANNRRSHKIFEKIFYYMLNKTMKTVPTHKFKFKNPLYSMDSSTIDLCLSLHDWAKFRTTKGGIKLHLKYDHSGYIPSFAVITNAKVNDMKAARLIPYKKGDVVVFDRGYNDYELFATYYTKGIYFITRLKKNAKYKVIERRSVKKYKNISSDQIIEFTGFYSKQKCPLRLRRIRVKDPETGKYIVLLTNHLTWSVKTIASIYKERWQIEIFFKTMKQRLKIKSFLGTTENAIKAQIWVALITYLLLSYLKFQSKYGWTIYNLSIIIATCLFLRKDLWEWINYPFGVENNRFVDTLQGELF